MRAVSSSLRNRWPCETVTSSSRRSICSKCCWTTAKGLASGLIDRAGGNSRAILKATEDALGKLPKVSGSGAGQVYLAPELARAFDAAEKAAEKAGDSFVTVERLLLGLTLEKGSEAGAILSKGGVTPQNLNAAIEVAAQGPHRRFSARPKTPMTR